MQRMEHYYIQKSTDRWCVITETNADGTHTVVYVDHGILPVLARDVPDDDLEKQGTIESYRVFDL